MSRSINVIPSLKKLPSSSGFWLLFVATVAPIWFIGHLFLQDYPDWIVQGALAKDLLVGKQPMLPYDWAAMPLPPNSLTTVILALLQTIFPPDLSGRFFLTLMLLATSARIYAVCGPGHPLRYWGFFLLLNFYFYAGFLPFIAGLTACVFVLPAILNGSEGHPRPMLLLLGSLLTYLVHGFAFGLFLVAVVWRFFSVISQEKEPHRHLTYYLALLPALVLSGIYVWATPVYDNQVTFLFYDSLLHWAQTLRYGLMPIPRVAGIMSDIPLSLINGLFWILIAVSLPLFWEMWPKRLAVGGFLLSCAVLAVFNPFFRIANFMNISPRLFPALLLLLPLLLNEPGRRQQRKRWLPTTAILLLIMANGLFFYSNGNTIDQVRRQIAGCDGLKPRLVIGKLPVEDFDKRFLQAISGVIQPYIRINFLDRLNSGERIFNIQETGLLAQEDVLSLITLRRADRLFDHARTRQQIVTVAGREKAWLAKHFPRILIFGSKDTRQAIVSALAEYYDPHSSGDQWQLLERAHEK